MRFADKDKFSSYLKKWQTLLLIINASLENAEGKQTSSRLLELWLSDLRDVAYDAEDIIDELTTEARRRQITEDPDAASPTCKVGIILIIQAIDSDSGESYAANAFAIWIWRREKSTVAELLDYQLFVALLRTWK
ncbi:putative disease resistance RPP13-like protein 1 isoform X2 [Gossypium arboreum]|uniref:putative disease resistance RPP13-like protein 1 isoform X2 n=1 Tax=Gossypium arboreum TaxID=29729 RepID=UPI0022F19D68|nr:putative disease resistance RPP13-like protein 1 isoform X2 [Gossypium arboreum]